jgi:prepilin-type N-terminal cleavage/methylation domain-containing protein
MFLFLKGMPVKMDLHGESGFTLIELVLVIVIMSFLSVGVYIAWPGSTINLKGQADQIASDIRYAQALSMTKGERYRWVKTSSTTYQITNSSGTAILLAGGSTTVTLNSGMAFGSFTDLPNNLVVFGGNGTPYTDTGSPGTALASTAIIPITAGSETKNISISPETGRVIVS